MRRPRQQLADDIVLGIMQRATSGVLALIDPTGSPYAVPLSFVYHEGHIFFHCAAEGHKMEAVRHCPKASFCVIAQDDVVAAKYTTRYRSVIAFGTLRIVEDIEEKRAALCRLAEKYAPHETGLDEEFRRFLRTVVVLDMQVEEMTGKQGKELLNAK